MLRPSQVSTVDVSLVRRTDLKSQRRVAYHWQRRLASLPGTVNIMFESFCNSLHPLKFESPTLPTVRLSFVAFGWSLCVIL